MTGDAEKILRLWNNLVGNPGYEDEDLSHVWAVQLGSHTEVLNLDWYERRTGFPLAKRGDVIVHPQYDWAACTLDAWDEQLSCPVECKHVGGFEKTAVIIERYMPQAHWQMIVTGADKCAFSIIEGAREPIIEIVPYDPAYGAELLSRAKQFMDCVFNITPPVVLLPVSAPVKAEKVYRMDGNNAWASEAVTWLGTRQARKDNEAADKAIKALVPADAVKCIGYGITVSRSKSGSLSIRENKE